MLAAGSEILSAYGEYLTGKSIEYLAAHPELAGFVKFNDMETVIWHVIADGTYVMGCMHHGAFFGMADVNEGKSWGCEHCGCAIVGLSFIFFISAGGWAIGMDGLLGRLMK
jgi:hypothetical protein